MGVICTSLPQTPTVSILILTSVGPTASGRSMSRNESSCLRSSTKAFMFIFPRHRAPRGASSVELLPKTLRKSVKQQAAGGGAGVEVTA